MTLSLKRFNTSDGPQIAVVDLEGDVATTVVVLSETDADGLTSGQLTFKHSIEKGTEPGTWTE